MSLLEIINLISVGLAEYNFKLHVASDIGIDQLFLPPENIRSQENLNKIEDWTATNKMKLNKEKTKIMVFNYTYNYQFSTRLYIEEVLIEIISETKLLGVIIRSDLSWHSNTKMLIKKAYSRMTILRKLYSFKIPVKDLVTIYITYIRCLLEQSCVLWHSSLTEENRNTLERVQKVSLRIIMGDEYSCYEDALKLANLETLEERRTFLCLEFAKSCIKSPSTCSMFPQNDSQRQEQKRNCHSKYKEKYKVQYARTDRLYKSAIPYMQRLLNSEANSK